MFVILGATGNVGSACAHELLQASERVLAIVHREESGEDLRAAGAETVVADVDDADALRAAFKRGKRAFLLNPPGDISRDSDAIESRQVASILAALEGAGLEKVVGESTMGAAQIDLLRGEGDGGGAKPIGASPFGGGPLDRIGDSSVLWEFEQGLARSGVPAAIQRGGYYYTNFDMQLDRIREEGVLTTMIPADLAIQMVSPIDLGRAAARLLREPPDRTGITATEGPKRYSANDVARIFADALGRDVRVEEVPRDQWREGFQRQGFSQESADAYARMTEIAVDSGFNAHSDVRGAITLEEHVAALVAGG